MHGSHLDSELLFKSGLLNESPQSTRTSGGEQLSSEETHLGTKCKIWGPRGVGKEKEREDVLSHPKQELPLLVMY